MTDRAAITLVQNKDDERMRFERQTSHLRRQFPWLKYQEPVKLSQRSCAPHATVRKGEAT